MDFGEKIPPVIVLVCYQTITVSCILHKIQNLDEKI